MTVKTAPGEPPKNRFKSPRLIIPAEVYKKIMFWVDESSFECSWLGTIDHDKVNNIFHVVDVFLLKQENGSASTDLDQNEIAKLLYEQRDNPFDIRWWGHSHVKMDVFWSGTDIATMEILSDGGWFISTVFNQHRKMKTAFTQLSPVPVMIDNVDTSIVDYLSEAERIEWKKEYNEKVTNKTPVYITTTYKGQGKPSFYSSNGPASEKKVIPPPANMPDWKQYATDKWKEGLHDAEAADADTTRQYMMEADAGPEDDMDPFADYESFRPNRKKDDKESALSPQEEEFYNALYEEYTSMKNEA